MYDHGQLVSLNRHACVTHLGRSTCAELHYHRGRSHLWPCQRRHPTWVHPWRWHRDPYPDSLFYSGVGVRVPNVRIVQQCECLCACAPLCVCVCVRQCVRQCGCLSAYDEWPIYPAQCLSACQCESIGWHGHGRRTSNLPGIIGCAVFSYKETSLWLVSQTPSELPTQLSGVGHAHGAQDGAAMLP